MALADALREIEKLRELGRRGVDAVTFGELQAILRAYAQPDTPPQYKAEHGCSCPAHTGGELCNCGIGMPAPSKPKPRLRLRYEDTAEGQVAITILEQEGIKRGCGHVYTAKNGVVFRSEVSPSPRTHDGPTGLYLRGTAQGLDFDSFLVSRADARRIQEAVAEFMGR